MSNTVAIGTNLSEDYFPLIDQIDKIAKERSISRAGALRDILCDYFQYEPTQKARTYSTLKNQKIEVEC